MLKYCYIFRKHLRSHTYWKEMLLFWILELLPGVQRWWVINLTGWFTCGRAGLLCCTHTTSYISFTDGLLPTYSSYGGLYERLAKIQEIIDWLGRVDNFQICYHSCYCCNAITIYMSHTQMYTACLGKMYKWKWQLYRSKWCTSVVSYVSKILIECSCQLSFCRLHSAIDLIILIYFLSN